MEFLPTLWFILIAVLWIGYLFLEGFDLGVGMLMKFWARNESQRRQLLNTIGPVWDGNEVWLLTAGGATFAAFPYWYASLFAALYIPLTIALLALILRAVSIEYRSKSLTQRGRDMWDWAMAAGSAVAAFCVGAMLALTTTGLPLDANGDRVGGPFVWLNGYAILGGLAVVGFALIQAWAFLGLKTDGPSRVTANEQLRKLMPLYIAPLAVWAIIVIVANGNKLWAWAALAVAVAALLGSWSAAAKKREGWSFIFLGLFLAAGAASIFTSVYPVVLPSTIDAAYNLTIDNAASSSYTLTVMAWVAAIAVPIVLAYQAWTYKVFANRISEHHIPDHHEVVPL